MNAMSSSAKNPTKFGESTIHLRGLTKQFGSTAVLRGIDLEVPEGAIYALMGTNGAGKTTMIKVLMNILRASSGEARVLGMPSSNLTGTAFHRIAYVSENQELPDGMTVGGMLDYMRPFYPLWDCALERQLVEQFHLPLGRKLKHLSRGMKMKAAFASSLAYRPKLIVLDEPLSGLDPLVRDELIEGLLERAPETTIFISSHDLAEIESFASHVGFLEGGRMLFSDEITAVSERFREITVTLAAPGALPERMPRNWLLVETVDCVVRFVASGYREGDTEREIAEIFPKVRAVEVDPMSLRRIFLAIAKSGRKGEARQAAEFGQEVQA
ncbi:MAG TPA: ABC transporter ATP-binding protein [Acidobacteriaceae bacterium]|nr:ABC transporter ATP-binding protein [Acidobacteriaceae bacterium]